MSGCVCCYTYKFQDLIQILNINIGGEVNSDTIRKRSVKKYWTMLRFQ